MDCALLQLVLELGQTYGHWRDAHPEASVRRYSSVRSDPPARQFTAAATQQGSGVRVYCRGGMEVVLEICSLKAQASSAVSELTLADKESFAEDARRMQGEELEVVALAHKIISDEGECAWFQRKLGRQKV